MSSQYSIDLSTLHQLLVHLAAPQTANSLWEWKGWRIEAISGGMNNRIFRATADGLSWAVKFTRQDGRDRAGREWHTLNVLQNAGLSIAPVPVLLERDRYSYPVVVQSWEEGIVADEPPTSDGDWSALLAHLYTVHCLTAERVDRLLPKTVLTMKTAAEALAAIRFQSSLLPEAGWSGELRGLVGKAERIAWPDWPPVTETLCRADPNIRNFVQRPGPWKSVDWEYSGWCDPAFEIADLIVHPSYASVPESRWDWVIERYCSQNDDPGCEKRIRVYRALMLVWWRVRLARYLHDEGLDASTQLVTRPEGWRGEKEQQIQEYHRQATLALSYWPPHPVS